MKARPAAASRTPTRAARSSLPAQGVHEPSFRRSASGGIRDHLLPGNKQYIEGDTIPRPPSGGGGGGSEGSPDGEGEDDFRFALSRDEFVDLFLEDLELPDLAKRRVVDTESAELAARRLFGQRLAGQPGADADGAEQPVAPHRAAAAEARRTAALRDEIDALVRRRCRRSASLLEDELDAEAAPHRR